MAPRSIWRLILVTYRVPEVKPTWRWAALTAFGPAIHAQGGLFAFASACGMFSSAVKTFTLAALASFTTNMKKDGRPHGCYRYDY